MRALRLPTRALPVTYLVRFRGPRDSSSFRVRCCQRSRDGWRSRLGPGSLFNRRSNCRCVLAWTRVGPLRFPDDPSCAFAPFLDPGRADNPSPMTVSSVLPLRLREQRLQRYGYIEANDAASAHAVYASRVVLPPPHARLASGWLAGLCRVGVEPTGSIAVGTQVTPRPPHRSVRAQLL
jgi:hypothetical protein